MEEIKFDKMSSKDDESSYGKEVEKSRNGPPQSNSKFYVDCNDIDSTVSFPLKLVSAIDDQNNEAVGEQLKRFPIVPWPRPLQVQSFFSSLPMDTDSFGSRNDKQILNADINGNPFTRNTRPSNLASFVSSTLMDYSNGGMGSEGKNRKNKRLRNSGNKGVLSENIAGHRGEEDIDSLLQFINSSDKKAKSAVKGNSQNQIISTKSSLIHDNERKKSFGKEMKNCHKNVINVVKKSLKRSSSLENISSSISNDVSDVFMFEPRGSASDVAIKDSNAVNDNSAGKILDINSNEENKFNEMNERDSADEASLHNDAHSSPEVSSFAADFYSTADVSSQTIEESGFLIVKKKQRKKHQSKRSESYRWRNAQAQRKKGIMLPLAESKCGKQDSRRKSTSSVPHSEHSSADNSDLDSVHSLPVRGSVPHPTQPHPHTTPSSSSSTPQASYADIARMPISKLNSPSPNITTHSSQAAVKPQAGEPDVKRTDIAGNGTSSAKHRVSDLRESCSLSKGSPNMPVIENESDNSSTSDVKIRSHAKSTREINTQTEPENAVNITETKLENSTAKQCKKADESSKNLCNSCSSRKNNCTCSKSCPGARQKAKSVDIPPVIMDNMPSESNACNVSFGFGIEEVLQMTPAENASSSFDLGQKDNLDISGVKNVEGGEMLEKRDGIFGISSVNSKSSNIDSCSRSSHTSEVASKSVCGQDLSQEQSSHLKKVHYGTDRNICYSETEVNLKKFNHSELVNFVGNEYHAVEKEIKGISRNNKVNPKVMYYVDSSEEK